MRLSLLSAIVLFTLASSLSGADAKQEKPPARSTAAETAVVKVFATSRFPDPHRPWTKQNPQEGTGSGVIIEGRRILTNAHVVAYASQVQVQANQSGDKISATVEAIAYGIDLAVLKLDDESFFDNRPPLARASKLPAVKDTVLVHGFPSGGTNLSITKGIVSRIDFSSYNYPTSGLRIQIDAAINPGNSGGPVVGDDQMIGLAFSRLMGREAIGYIIPCEEIELFLKDVADGRYDGKPTLFDTMQTFENPALRPFLKVAKGVDGMIVTQPDTEDLPNASYPLKPWDIITRIGDSPIDNEGMVRVGDIRVRFQYMIQNVARDGKLPLTIVRDGKEQKIEVPVAPRRPTLIPDLDGAYPQYFVYGPIVFSGATSLFAASVNAGMLTITRNPLGLRRLDRPEFDGEALVVVASPFFPHKLSKGYSSMQSSVIEKVNGTKIKNLPHLVQVLRDLKDEFVVFESAGRRFETTVFPRKEMEAATEEILTDNGIRLQGTPELMAIWNKKP